MDTFFSYLAHDFTIPLKNPVLVFSLILFIILLAPIVLRRFKIPGIIGLIISGVVIGPYGLGILEKNSAVDLFSTIGLLYIMFIAGLELDLHEFKGTRNKSLLFGLLTFIFPMAIGYPVCRYFLGYGVEASLLTASMFSTHTLVAYPIVSRLGVSKNRAVLVAVGGTILTDTAVLILLAAIINKSQGTFNNQFLLQLGIALAVFSAIMFVLIPRIAKWFFQKLESEKHAHYIFVLAVVFFAAFLAQASGLEPIIGAFAAGLALNRLIPHSSPLMNRIEFIGNALFIPFFLISVGMIVNLSVIFKGTRAITIAAVLTIVALAGKWLAALATQLIYKFSVPQRQLIFGLSSSHAAATLAIILVGYRTGILDENILNGTVILILVTCLTASFVTEKAARKILLTQSTKTKLSPDNLVTNEHIMVSLLGPNGVHKMVEFALLVKEKKAPSPVTILSVVPNDHEAETNIAQTRKKLDEYVSLGAATETKIKTIATIDHNTVSGITRISREIMATLVLVDWPEKSPLVDILIGDRMDQLLEKTDKNMMVCCFTRSTLQQKRIVLVTPPLAEKEIGFETWAIKVARLAKELNMPVLMYGQNATWEAFMTAVRQKHLLITIQFNSFDDWDDFLVLSRVITNDTLLVVVLARKSALSYQSPFDTIPAKLEKHFPQHNKILVYPHLPAINIDTYSDFAAPSLSKSIGALGKEIGGLFKSE